MRALKRKILEHGPLWVPFAPVEYALRALAKFLSEKTYCRLSFADVYERYKRCSPHLHGTVLEVGGSQSLLRLFFKGNATYLDVQFSPDFSKHETCVVGNGMYLPFPDSTFSCVLSTAVLEHIPRHLRHAFCNELKRVAKDRVVLYCPISPWARVFDNRLVFMRKILGIRDRWTLEHLQYGQPTLAELTEYFPDAQITCLQNANVWLIITFLQSIPVISAILPGIARMLLRRFDSGKPTAAIVVWAKKSLKSSQQA